MDGDWLGGLVDKVGGYFFLGGGVNRIELGW